MAAAAAAIRLSHKGMREVLMTLAEPLVRRHADQLAASARGAAGVIGRQQVHMRMEHGHTPYRFRAAIIVSHPVPQGRQAGMDALRALVG